MSANRREFSGTEPPVSFIGVHWRPFAVALILPAVLWLTGHFCLRLAPIPGALLRPPVQSISLVDRNGIPLREARVEERFSRELALEDVPRHVIDAVLAAEDKRFFRHGGIDWLATGRAIVTGLSHGRITSGASTITQQLIKISERRPRTLRAKLIESVTALRLEQIWSKDQILAAYLNRIDFGNLNIGLASAADYYFGKPVSDLSDAEAAFLAGLPKNPRKLNPHVALDAARRRQETVLRRLHANGWLDAARFARAHDESLALRPPARRFRAPHFVELVLQQPQESPRSELQTTLDLRLNEVAEKILRERLAQLREQNVRNGAVVIIDNASGDVIALVGSENYFAPGTGMVNGAWAQRSAGSTLKPFTYLLALERGATPATMVADVRTSFPSADGFYRPENYNRRCYGPVRYRTALASSLNIPAVKVLLAAGGPEALHERLRLCGLTTLDRPPEIYGPGLTLGNCEGRLLEITNAYASLARLGEYRPWRVLTTAPAAAHRYSRPELVWQIADIMSDNAARTLAFGMNSALRFDYPVACKTGTSTDFRDNWTIGFTPEFSVGVWVGNFDGSPMREVSGVTGAGPILHEIFDYLHANRGTSWYRTPAEIVERKVHPLTGKLLAETDPRGIREKFVSDQLPAQESPGDYDGAGNVQLGPEYADWFNSAENGIRDRVALASMNGDLRITSPLPGSVYVVDPDVPSTGRIPLAANGGTLVKWESDSLTCRSESGADFALAAEGEHRIIVTDLASGRHAETWIRIRSL
ncbi:MAG: penicillin-binding protein 1C [Verrucomicrobia bacterium]|nr:MAG: penicillin-binding protein 1C [Verrucomicrobiota bacterium]